MRWSVHKFRFHLLFTNQWESSCLTWLLMNGWIKSSHSFVHVFFICVLRLHFVLNWGFANCKPFSSRHIKISHLSVKSSLKYPKEKIFVPLPYLPFACLAYLYCLVMKWVFDGLVVGLVPRLIAPPSSISSQDMRSDSMSNSSSTKQ